MKKNIIYHNPRCSKSREALATLADNSIQVEVVEYLKNPPTPKELKSICRILGASPTEIIRSKEARFKELRLSLNDQRSEDEWIKILCDDPSLIERPIVVINGRGVIGRPPEKVLEIL